MAVRAVEALVRAFAAVLLAGLLVLGVASWRAVPTTSSDRPASPADAKAAVEAIRTMLTLANHLRKSGGDVRFAERIPAAGEVVAEIFEGLDFAAHLGVVEDPRLVRFEARAVTGIGPGLVEVKGTEYWVTRVEGREVEARSVVDVLSTRYVVGRESSGWRVLDWGIDAGAAPAAGAP